MFVRYLAADILYFYLKGQAPLNSINHFQHLTMYIKISFDGSMQRPPKETCSGALIFRILLNWQMCQNTYYGTTTYRILAPRYKSIADSEDFGTLIAARYKPVSSSDHKLARRYEIVKISSPAHEICGWRYINPAKLIFVIVNR